MVWGGISLHHRTPLVIIDGNMTAQRYVDNVVRPVVVPFMENHPHITVFQQDNARPHSARLTQDFLTDQEIRVMPWPAYSPDLNPIEQLWDHLGRQVAARPPANRDALIRILQGEWEAIPQEIISNLIRSMRERCTDCFNARGGHTRF